MLSTITAERILIRTLHPEPVSVTAWMVATAPPVSAMQRWQLAPGFWIVRERQWWPVSVLDTVIDAPFVTDVEDVEIPRRIYPHPDWHLQAACAGVGDSDSMFFGIDDEGRPALPPRFFRAARAICAGCPVAQTCLSWALTKPEKFGIWAGTTGRQRAAMQTRIQRGGTVEQEVTGWLKK